MNKKLKKTYSIDPIVYEAAKELAKEDSRSLSSYIEMALKHYNKLQSEIKQQEQVK